MSMVTPTLQVQFELTSIDKAYRNGLITFQAAEAQKEAVRKKHGIGSGGLPNEELLTARLGAIDAAVKNGLLSQEKADEQKAAIMREQTVPAVIDTVGVTVKEEPRRHTIANEWEHHASSRARQNDVVRDEPVILPRGAKPAAEEGGSRRIPKVIAFDKTRAALNDDEERMARVIQRVELLRTILRELPDLIVMLDELPALIDRIDARIAQSRALEPVEEMQAPEANSAE